MEFVAAPCTFCGEYVMPSFTLGGSALSEDPREPAKSGLRAGSAVIVGGKDGGLQDAVIVGGSAASRCAAGGVLSSCDTPDTPLLCLAALVKSCASTRAVFDAGAAPREPPPSGRFNGTTSTLDPVEDGARGRGADDGARLRGTVACAGVSGGGARTGGAESGT
eukprot:1001240-Rhodomonas_salina.1